MLFLQRQQPHPHYPSSSLVAPHQHFYVADSVSASHGWSLMRSGGLERERARKRGRRTDEPEAARERRDGGGDGPAPLGIGYSLLLSAIGRVGSQNALALQNAQ